MLCYALYETVNALKEDIYFSSSYLLLVHTHSSFHINQGLINICRTKFVRWLVPDTVRGCEW